MGKTHSAGFRRINRPSKAPRYCQGFEDRHGKTRWYLRKPGCKRVALPGLPWSTEFMDAYQNALGNPSHPGEKQIKPGTIADLVSKYLDSAAFRSLAPTTQASYRRYLNKFREKYGEGRVKTLTPASLRQTIELQAKKSAHSGNHLRKVIRVALDYAVSMGMIDESPADFVRKVKTKKTRGYRTWTEDDVAMFEERHPVGTVARLALTLFLYTGQRRADVCAMGPQHIRHGRVTVRQSKTGTEVIIPAHPTLLDVIEKSPRTGAMAFLLNRTGEPYKAGTITDLFAQWTEEAGITAPCTAHGLRKTVCRRLAEAGCTAHEIMAVTGHQNISEVQRYTEAYRREKLSEGAVFAMDGTKKVSNFDGRFDETAKKPKKNKGKKA